jgi:hypothetical protein
MRLTGDMMRQIIESGRAAEAAAGTAPQTEPQTSDDTIYYVKTSKPHLKDIAISGPFRRLQDVLPHLREKLRSEGSVAGESTLDDLVFDGRPTNFVHLNAPLPDGNMMRLELLAEENAEVARSLPGDAWYVVVAEPFLGRTGGGSSDGTPPMKDVQVHATYKTEQEANGAAQRVLQELKADAGNGAFAQTGSQGGSFGGVVFAPASRWSRMVQVNHDTGRTVETNA